jgi:TonB family protein
VAQELPPELNMWGRQMQRKIDYAWEVPMGLRLDAERTVAEISFWVNRDGELLETPIVSKPASDPALGESGVRAIMLAVPFPPFPAGYKKDEVQVVYEFSLQ